ncbi:BrnA antitoxin family protein [Brachymonas sp. J145]|uniref:BrnA antitoxin family protein n=1 Tax=Brachymonas sp. J145 TaxID=3116489 RepID=UPI002E777572|nr:BrnA antitoxin family protein [Brachymonas sp. J145]MEE1653423.1 BrnA antitoxin family protein [Brachymonas sp. J145]
MNAKSKKFSALRSDEEAERFVDSADLSEYDLSEFKPMRFELSKKEASLNMRLPSSLMNAIRAKAEALGIPYSRYVRMVLEADVQRGR